MLPGLYKLAHRVADMADELQKKNPSLSRIEAVEHALAIVKKEPKN